MASNKIKELDEFLEDGTEEGTVCDIDGNCTSKFIRRDKSIVERVNKKIMIEDGRQLLM